MQKLSVIDIQFDKRNSDLNEVKTPLSDKAQLSPKRKSKNAIKE